MIAPWTCDRERLERELRRPGYVALLDELRAAAPEAAALDDWRAVGRFLVERGITSERADCLLRPLAAGLSTAPEPRRTSVFFYLFLPALIRLQWSRRRWHPASDERWSLICWSFLRSLSCLDPERRRERLGQKLINDTGHRLYDECARGWKRARRELPHEPDELDALTGGLDDPAFDVVDRSLVHDRTVRHVRAAVAAGVVTETDGDLLLGHRIYGVGLAASAAACGLAHECVKKRVQRAERKIARARKLLVPARRVGTPLHG